MRRFLVFGFAVFYPQGGFKDFEDSFDTKEEAINFIDKEEHYEGQRFQIVDSENPKELEQIGF